MPQQTFQPQLGKTPDWVDRRSEIRSWSLRSLLRNFTLDILTLGRRLDKHRILAGPCVQFLVLHHVFLDEIDSFRELLKQLRFYYRIVGYGEAVQRVVEGRIDQRYLAISFDDGLKCCRHAAEILLEFSLPGCFFVCPTMIGETNCAVVERFCRERLDLPPVEFMTWDDIHWLQDRGHEIGGHTMGHVDLAGIPRNQAQQEISESFDTLTQQLGYVKHFAWPYGQAHHITPELVRFVFQCGYQSCASSQRGCHKPGSLITSQDECILRDNIEANWPFRHVSYFLNRNARKTTEAGPIWPISP